jgi:hypothetical protein
LNAAVALLTAVSALVPAPAHAFGTVNGILGQDVEHEKITRRALQVFVIDSEVIDQIAGKRFTWGAVGYPDLVAVLGGGKAPDHCDSGDFIDTAPGYPHSKADASQMLKECRKQMYDNMEAAVTAAGLIVDVNGVIAAGERRIPFGGCGWVNPKQARCEVMMRLGRVFHAAQDFYSHSNWSDRIDSEGVVGDVTRPPGLGGQDAGTTTRQEFAAFINLGLFDPNNPMGREPDPKLMTGCYDGKPESFHCSKRTRHNDLNKDKGEISDQGFVIGKPGTDRGRLTPAQIKAGGESNFYFAVTAAVADTQDKWRHFETRVVGTYPGERGEKILCVISSKRADLC